MKRRYGVNIVFFGNIWTLISSFVFGWNFKQISSLLQKRGLGLMLIPVRGINRITYKQIPSEMVLTYEEAWNSAFFTKALLRFIKDLLKVGFLFARGSFTGKKSSGFTQIDKIAGMNFGSEGTVIDWLLFGNRYEALNSLRRIKKLYPKAIRSAHDLIASDLVFAREINPEMEIQYKRIKFALKLGKQVPCFPGLENELDLILHSDNFVDYLKKSNLKFCLDIFHTFQRGSRDGSNPYPVVPQSMSSDFLWSMQPKVVEVHFRLDKVEVEEILNGNASKLKTFLLMKQIYETYDCDIIYELYPDLFSTNKKSALKVSKVHKMLLKAFINP